MIRVLLVLAAIVIAAWLAACGATGEWVVNGALILAAFLAFGAWVRYEVETKR